MLGRPRIRNDNPPMTDDAFGASRSTDELFPVVYQELKRLARSHLRRSNGRSTICTTELVHEAFLRLTGGGEASWESRAHFFGSASRAMRQVLVAFARRRDAAKRGGGGGGAATRLSLADAERAMLSPSDTGRALEIELDQILAIDEALHRLDAVNQRLRQVVELRFFGGVTEDEIAKMLGVSPRTVERDWLKARLFLLRELAPEDAAADSGPR